MPRRSARIQSLPKSPPPEHEEDDDDYVDKEEEDEEAVSPRRGKGRGRAKQRRSSPASASANDSSSASASPRKRGRPARNAAVNNTAEAVVASPPLSPVRKRSILEDLGEAVEGRRCLMTDDDYCAKHPGLRVSSAKDKGLRPQAVDLCSHINSAQHHTALYDVPPTTLVARRGQPVTLQITFDRPLDQEKDRIVLQMAVGSRPQQNKCTLVRMEAGPNVRHNPAHWSADIGEVENDRVKLTVMIPTDAVIGSYELYVETDLHTSSAVPASEANAVDLFLHRFKYEGRIVVLFNAWCQDDDVYMSNTEEREEYVMKETGTVWTGAARYRHAVPWNFGQFDSPTLDCALHLLDHSQLHVSARGSAPKVIRAISAMTNYNEKDGGVLVGRWSELYPKNTTAPSAWAGSSSIVQKFMHRKFMVKYAHCATFGALATSLCRALGIPSRCVTCYDSAHDTDATHTVDYHFSVETLRPLYHMNDGVWNHHVWTEAWTRRRDLPDGSQGWQAFDATPQETSEGVVAQCGPAPVSAIKAGEVYLPYDTRVMYGSVSGHRVYWLVEEGDGSMSVARVDHSSIGRAIVTGADGQDITHCYKYPAKSPEARTVELRAEGYSNHRLLESLYSKSNRHSGDVKIRVDVPEPAAAGEDIQMTLHVVNTSQEQRSVRLVVSAFIGYYTGVDSYECIDADHSLELAPAEEKTLPFTVTAANYALHVLRCPELCLRAYVCARVEQTDQIYVAHDIYEFLRPKITVEVPPEPVYANEPFTVTLTATNPHHSKLQNAEFHVECAGTLEKSLTVPVRTPHTHFSGRIPPLGPISATARFTPFRSSAARTVTASTPHTHFSGRIPPLGPISATARFTPFRSSAARTVTASTPHTHFSGRIPPLGPISATARFTPFRSSAARTVTASTPHTHFSGRIPPLGPISATARFTPFRSSAARTVTASTPHTHFSGRIPPLGPISATARFTPFRSSAARTVPASTPHTHFSGRIPPLGPISATARFTPFRSSAARTVTASTPHTHFSGRIPPLGPISATARFTPFRSSAARTVTASTPHTHFSGRIPPLGPISATARFTPFRSSAARTVTASTPHTHFSGRIPPLGPISATARFTPFRSSAARTVTASTPHTHFSGRIPPLGPISATARFTPFRSSAARTVPASTPHTHFSGRIPPLGPISATARFTPFRSSAARTVTASTPHTHFSGRIPPLGPISATARFTPFRSSAARTVTASTPHTHFSGRIPPLGPISATARFTPFRSSAARTVTACLTAAELPSAHGHVTVQVHDERPRPEPDLKEPEESEAKKAKVEEEPEQNHVEETPKEEEQIVGESEQAEEKPMETETPVEPQQTEPREQPQLVEY